MYGLDVILSERPPAPSILDPGNLGKGQADDAFMELVRFRRELEWRHEIVFANAQARG
jgi:hypothetical protein